MPQKLSPAARKAKKARDLAYAKTPRRRKMKAETPRRRKMKAENQRLRRAATKKGKNLKGLDYDHNTKSFISVKKNRSGHGKGTKKYNTK